MMLRGRLHKCHRLLVGPGGGELTVWNTYRRATQNFQSPSCRQIHFASRFINQQRQQHRPPSTVSQALVRFTRRPKHTKEVQPTQQTPTSPSTSSAASGQRIVCPESATAAAPAADEGVGSLYLGTHVWRLACAFGIVYVVTEYGIELTICEGPSMMPTIQPRGEIVIMDRCTPRLWGLHGGGPKATERATWARRLQRQHEKQQQQQQHPPRTPDWKQTWYEERIPVNRLPREGAWQRLQNQLLTGISVGDVVVLQHPDRVGTVCKRVLGLPGDVVTKPSTQRGASRVQNRHGQQQTNLAALRHRLSATTLEIPDGHIWVEGDNPWNSSDSRNYGPVPASLIMGRVLCRVWPLRGSALMERGDRPVHDETTELPSLAFSGSVVFPAGYEDQIILNHGRDNKGHPQLDEYS